MIDCSIFNDENRTPLFITYDGVDFLGPLHDAQRPGEDLLVDAELAAAIAGYSVDHWHNEVYRSAAPKPIVWRIRALWSLQDLEAWIEDRQPACYDFLETRDHLNQGEALLESPADLTLRGFNRSDLLEGVLRGAIPRPIVVGHLLRWRQDDLDAAIEQRHGMTA